MRSGYSFCRERLIFFPYAIKDRYEDWPVDGVDISPEEYASFSTPPHENLVIGADELGYPIWVEKPAPTYDEKCTDARRYRDDDISSSMWVVERHRSQSELNIETTLSTQQYTELLVYHQALRNWPEQPGWPDIEMPPKPAWLVSIEK